MIQVQGYCRWRGGEMLIIEKDGKVTMQCKAARNEKGGEGAWAGGNYRKDFWCGRLACRANLGRGSRRGRGGEGEGWRANGLTETQI